MSQRCRHENFVLRLQHNIAPDSLVHYVALAPGTPLVRPIPDTVMPRQVRSQRLSHKLVLIRCCAAYDPDIVGSAYAGKTAGTLYRSEHCRAFSNGKPPWTVDLARYEGSYRSVGFQRVRGHDVTDMGAGRRVHWAKGEGDGLLRCTRAQWSGVRTPATCARKAECNEKAEWLDVHS